MTHIAGLCWLHSVSAILLIQSELLCLNSLATEKGIHSLFVVVYRNPNGGGLVEWPSYNLNEEYLQINLNQKKASKLKEKKVDFWRKVMSEKKNNKRTENKKVNSEL